MTRNGKWWVATALLLVCAGAISAEHRVALVIGNDAYGQLGRLNNARNDARAVAARLSDLGFELVGGQPQLDVDRSRGVALIKQFGETLRSGDTAFFYFAGHGVGGDGTNYLIPTDDAQIAFYEDVPDFALDVQSVLNRMKQRGDGINIVILDACRDRGLPMRTRSGTARGLSRVSAPSGTFIGYAASPGEKSFDGSAGNGVFTAEFVRLLGKPGYTMEDIFADITEGVQKVTNGQQTPLRESNLIGRWMLVPVSATTATTNGQSGQIDPLALELAFWQSTQAIDRLSGYQAYEDQYPSGRFGALARIAKERLSESASVNAASSTTHVPAVPLQDSPMAGSNRIELMTSMGRVVVKMLPDRAPISVKNFLEYLDAGHYDGTIFHRVIDGFMVQGGGYTVGLTEKAKRSPIASEARNGLTNRRGTFAMARTGEPHTARAQFFINLVDNPRLDFVSEQSGMTWGYTVFGEIVEGMEVIDRIAKVPTASAGAFARDVPVAPIVISHARRLP